MKIRISEIKGKPFQSRKNFDEKEIKIFAEDIKSNGLLQPIIVRYAAGGGYDLIAGERRLRAHQVLGLTEIEAEIKKVDDKTAARMAGSENIQRENLTPLEQADAIEKMLAESTIEEVAETTGRGVGYITRCHKLLDLSPAWKKAIESGFAKDYPLSVLVEIARASEDEQKSIWEQWHWEHSGIPTTSQIREEIFKDKHFIDSAQFDAADCIKCQYSTCSAPALFDDVVNAKKGDQCLNEECWIKKTTDVLETKVAEFKKENPTGVVIADYSIELPHDHEIKKNAINYFECTKAKKSNKGTIPALDLKTGKIENVKLTQTAAKEVSKRDAEGHLTIKERRARLEKRRIVRFLGKIISVIEEMVKNRHEFHYTTIVPLISIFGAERLPDKKGHYGWRDPLDEKINYDHSQLELLICLVPKMIGALRSEIQSATPQKKRGDVFKEWLGIQTDKLYTEACEEIPEPKSWSAETGGMKTSKRETKSLVRTCRICGCTENNACIDENGNICSWIEKDLCSLCICRACKAAHPECQKCCAKCKKPCNAAQVCRKSDELLFGKKTPAITKKNKPKKK